jgi:hypothetical protein
MYKIYIYCICTCMCVRWFVSQVSFPLFSVLGSRLPPRLPWSTISSPCSTHSPCLRRPWPLCPGLVRETGQGRIRCHGSLSGIIEIGRGHYYFAKGSTFVLALFADLAFAASSWWPRSSSIQHSHFYRGGRGMARFSILTSIVVAAAWLDQPPSTPEPRPSPSIAQALSLPLAPHFSFAAPPPSPHLLLHSVTAPAAEPVPAFSIALPLARAPPTPSEQWTQFGRRKLPPDRVEQDSA